MNSHTSSLVAILFLATCLPCSVWADNEPMPNKSVQVIQRQSGNVVTLIAVLSGCTEVTITVSAELQNMTAWPPLPLTVDANGRQSFEICRLQPVDPRRAWHFSTRHSWLLGGRAGPRRTRARGPLA